MKMSWTASVKEQTQMMEALMDGWTDGQALKISEGIT